MIAIVVMMTTTTTKMTRSELNMINDQQLGQLQIQARFFLLSGSENDHLSEYCDGEHQHKVDP